MTQDINKAALRAVFQVSRCFAGSGDAHESVGEILAILDRVMGYKNGAVTLLDPESGDLLVEAVHGADKEKWQDVRYRKGEGITGLIMETSEPLAIPLVRNDPRFLHKLAIYNPDSAFLGVPIQAGDRTRGVLSVAVDAAERYRLDEHLKIVTMFANLLGGVLSRIFKAEKEKEVIIREKDRLQGQLKNHYRPENMVGVSKLMQDVFENIQQVAKWNTTVLIRGESGTGKELVAKGIHYQSLRSAGSFVKLNCAALPDTLLESELFGYEKGAFTGAAGSKPGRFELAHKGTLFLDEIGDTSPAFQAKLLRVLQEGQFERLGGTHTITVDVRLIAATNVDLERAVAEKKFREDLYYRLNVMPIYLPPLRERREDIPYLVDFFLDKFGKECGEKLSIEPEALIVLQSCDFMGNVRELENCVHRSAVRCKNFMIRAADIPCSGAHCSYRLLHPQETEVEQEIEGETEDIAKLENERDRIVAALKKSGWVQAKAARILNMTPRQIGYRIIKLNIEMKNF